MKSSISSNTLEMQNGLNILRIIMPALLAATSLSSCRKEPAPHNDGGYQVLFECTDYNTRSVATATNLRDDGFRVYAFYTLEGDSYDFNDNVKYTRGLWSFETPKYWSPGASYIFKAFYPKSLSQELLVTDDAYTISDYDITSQDDLMYAVYAMDAPKGEGVVPLEFSHLLSLVTIRLKTKIPGLIVSRVSLKDVSNSGNFENGSWTASVTADIDITHDPGYSLDASAIDYVDVTKGGFLMLPQTVTGAKQQLVVETSDGKTYDAYIPASSWDAGMNYTYTVNIKQENIVFNEPTVVQWDDKSATGSVIIK